MMASQQFMRLLRSRAPQIRSFTHTSPFLAAKSTFRVPPPTPFSAKSKSPPKSVPVRSNASPDHGPNRPANSPRPPLKQEQPPAMPTSTTQAYADRLLGNAESLLLYKSPRNVALFNSCFIVGSGLSLWIGTVSNGVFLGTVPWSAKLVVLAGCLAASAITLGIMMTPHHLVKSVSLVRAAEKGALLRIKGTRFFPFEKYRVFDVVPGTVLVDGQVTMSLESGRQWWNVPLQNAKVWTEGGLQRPDQIQGNAFQRLNRRMMNIAPAATRYVRKMFNREGMTYMCIGNGMWKMDLTGCEILENGTVLMKLVREGRVRKDIVGMATRNMLGN